jgi:GAF domain-containing protein
MPRREGESRTRPTRISDRDAKIAALTRELEDAHREQAGTAIENVRLFEEVQARSRELHEAHEFETAISAVLNVISRSPNQLQPVLDAIVEIAARLCEAYDANLWLVEGERLTNAAHRGRIPLDFQSWPIGRGWTAGRAVVAHTTIHVHDLSADADFPEGQAMAHRLGHRTIVSTPLLRKDEAIGVLALRRLEVRPFSQKQISLLQTFADQAVIAINNARLFEEVQTRTRELTESLDYQTATGEVLSVISRAPSRLQPVFDTIVETAAKLCHSDFAIVVRRGEDGTYHLAASHGFSPDYRSFVELHPLVPGRGTGIGRAVVESRTVQIEDVLADCEYTYGEGQRLGGYRTLLAVPLLREGKPVGAMALGRNRVQSFTEKQIELITSVRCLASLSCAKASQSA